MAIISCSRIKSQALQGSFFLAITNHPLYSTCLVLNDTALASQPEGCKSSNLSCIEDFFFEQLKWRCKHDRYQPKIYIHSLLCLRYFGTYKTLPGYHPKQPGHILLTRYRFWRANAYPEKHLNSERYNGTNFFTNTFFSGHLLSLKMIHYD